MNPINYTALQTNPNDALMQGVKTGLTFDAIAERQQALDAQKAQLQAQQEQAARNQQLMFDVMSNPNATYQQYGAIASIDPKMRESIKDQWDRMDSAKQQTLLGDTARLFSALKAGRADIALEIADTQLKAAENAGNPQAIQQAKLFKGQIERAPDVARVMIGAAGAALPGGDKFFASLGGMGKEDRDAAQAPAVLAKTQADAHKASVEAGNAPTKTALENQTAQEAILTAQNKRDTDRLNVEIGQADSETKRGQLVLERDKLIDTQEKTKIGGQAETQNAMDSANALLAQLNGVKGHPGLEAGTGTLGGIRAYFNSTDANDFRKAVEGLKSPLFLNALAKLKAAGITLGQVTEAEGSKLERSIGNLATDQSTPAFRNQVGVILKDTENFINKIVSSGKLPTSGGAFVMKHPTYGNVTEGTINGLLTKFPGSSREQVIKMLESSAKPESQIPR